MASCLSRCCHDALVVICKAKGGLVISRHDAVGVAIHFAAWIAMAMVVAAVFSHSEAATAYGLLSGWWCALYAATLTTPTIRAGAVAFVVFFVIDVVAAAMGIVLLQHDQAGLEASTIVNAGLRAVVFVSPIFANRVVGLLRQKLPA